MDDLGIKMRVVQKVSVPPHIDVTLDREAGGAKSSGAITIRLNGANSKQASWAQDVPMGATVWLTLSKDQPTS